MAKSLQMWFSLGSWKGEIILNYLNGPWCNHKCPYGDLPQAEERTMWPQKRRFECCYDHSQGMLAATRRWKMQGIDSPLEHPEGAGPCQHLDFGSLNWFHTCGLQDSKRISVCCFKPVNLWQFVTALTVN